MRQRESGFTLIELLVVILIVAILAAVAIPVFLKQREKGYEDQMRSALKNAITAVESYGVDEDGDYSGLGALTPPDLRAALLAQGFQVPPWARSIPGHFDVETTRTAFCIEARHINLTSSSAWRRSTYWSKGDPNTGQTAPVPQPDDCDLFPRAGIDTP